MYKDKINKLKEFYEDLEQKQEESEEEYDLDKTIISKYILTEEDEPKELEKPKKEKEPDYICIFDDLSGELKDRTIPYFLKKNRHFPCLCILSSQYWFNLAKNAQNQVDYMLMFSFTRRESRITPK